MTRNDWHALKVMFAYGVLLIALVVLLGMAAAMMQWLFPVGCNV